MAGRDPNYDRRDHSYHGGGEHRSRRRSSYREEGDSNDHRSHHRSQDHHAYRGHAYPAPAPAQQMDRHAYEAPIERVDGPPPGLQEYNYVIRCYIPPRPDTDASQNPARGHEDHSQWRQDSMGAQRDDYKHERYQSVSEEERPQRRDSRSFHPSGMGAEWAAQQAARSAREVEEELAKQRRRSERDARRVAEARAAEDRAAEARAAEARAASAAAAASGRHHGHHYGHNHGHHRGHHHADHGHHRGHHHGHHSQGQSYGAAPNPYPTPEAYEQHQRQQEEQARWEREGRKRH